MKKKEFDNILDECLERILTRGETIAQCLANYPEQAVELEPLLRTVLATRESLTVSPRPEFRDRARHQLRLALREMEKKPEKPERRTAFFTWQPRWATAVIAVLIFVLASGSTVTAAGGSMPDEPLYPVKLATEKVRLALTPSALGKAELYAKLADKRVAEIIKMAEKGKPEQAEQAAERLNSQLVTMATLVSPVARKGVLTLTAPPVVEEPGDEAPGVLMAPAPRVAEEPPRAEAKVPVAPALRVPQETPELAPAPQSPERVEPEVKGVKMDRQARLRMVVVRNIAKHREELRAALERAPESARPALRRALAASNAEYEKVLEILKEKDEAREPDDGENED